MKFLAIDSSLANTGVAIGNITPRRQITIESIHLSTTEKTKKKQVRASSDTIARCRKTYDFIHALIEKHEPQVVFVETPSGSQSSAGMKSYGATCQLIAGISPAPIQVTPDEVKVAFMDSKTASKKDIIEKAYTIFPNLKWCWHAGKLQAKNEHMADAIAIVYAGSLTEDFSRLSQLLS